MANYLGFDPAETTPYYFISYDTSDKERVSEYVTAMNAKGLPMWYDHGIHAGTEWESVIADHIVNCEAVILFFSKRIFLKDDSYVRKEFNLAVAYGKRIIVVLLDDVVQSDVPIKYALWWESVRDLQGVLAFTCANIDECVDKVLDGLNSKNTRTKTTARVSKPTTRKIASPEDKYAKKILKVLKAVPRKFTKSELVEESKLDLVEKEWRIILEKMKVDGDIAVKGDFIWATLYDEEEIDAYVDSAKQMVISFMENEIREYSADELIAAMPETIGLPYGTKVLSDLVDTKRIVKSNGYYVLSSIDVKAYHWDVFLNAINRANGWICITELYKLGFKGVDHQKKILSEMAKKEVIASKSSDNQLFYCSRDFAENEKKRAYDELVLKFGHQGDSKTFRQIRKGFIELGDYKDSADYALKCSKIIDELKHVEEEKQKEREKQKQREKEKAEDYERLIKSVGSYKELEEWQTAKKAFQKIGDYKQCNKYISLCDEKIKEINRTVAREKAYEAYLKKYPLLMRKEKIEMNHWHCEKEYKEALQKTFMWGIESIILYAGFLFALIMGSDSSAGMGIILLIVALITTSLWARAKERAQEYKVKIDEYNELKKIPPFEWKDES